MRPTRIEGLREMKISFVIFLFKNKPCRVFWSLLLILMLTKTYGQNSNYKDFINYARTSFGYDESTLNRIICKMSCVEEATVYDAIENMLEDRSVRLFSDIDDDVANVVQLLLLYFEKVNSKGDVILFIDSNGGSVYSGLGIYDTMQFVSYDVTTVCIGMAASMASVLLCSGTKGKRYAYPSSRIMIHSPVGIGENEVTGIEVQKLKKELYEIISGHTGQSYEKILIDCENDYWMTSQEALEYGMVDVIIKSIEKH